MFSLMDEGSLSASAVIPVRMVGVAVELLEDLWQVWLGRSC